MWNGFRLVYDPGTHMERVEPDLKVTDRRQFTADGVLKEDASTEAPAPVSSGAPAETTSSDAGADAPPPVTFPAFIISLATQAAELIGGEHRDLQAARQVISALEMLHDKTEGRRTEEESRLMEAVLFDLRMAFVGSTRGGRS